MATNKMNTMTVVLVTDDQVMTMQAYAVEISPRLRQFIEFSAAGDVYAYAAPYLADPGEVTLQICGQTEFHTGAASDGWTRLMQLAIAKITERQVMQAIHGSLSSESGKARHQIEDFTSSALKSLRESEEKAVIALKRQKKRAKRYLSATAFGLAGKPRNKPSKPSSKSGSRTKSSGRSSRKR